MDYLRKLFLPFIGLTLAFSSFIGECSHRTDLAENNDIKKISGKYFFKSDGEIFQTNAFNGCIRKITSKPKISRKTDNYTIINYYLELHAGDVQTIELTGEEIPQALHFFFGIPLPSKDEEGESFVDNNNSHD